MMCTQIPSRDFLITQLTHVWAGSSPHSHAIGAPDVVVGLGLHIHPQFL